MMIWQTLTDDYIMITKSKSSQICQMEGETIDCIIWLAIEYHIRNKLYVLRSWRTFDF